MTARLPIVLGVDNVNTELTENLLAPARLVRASEVTLTLSGDTNDAVVTGIGAATTIWVEDATGGHKLTGIIAGTLGDEITVVYPFDAIGTLVLTARDPASSSGNRFVMARNVTLKPYQSISFRYKSDAAGSGWYPIDDRFGSIVTSDVTDFQSSFVIPLSADTQSSKFGSATKLTLGRKYFDPTDAKWRLKVTSTATFYALLETTNAANNACCELFQETGTGSPQVIGTPTPTAGLTATLVSASVSAAFLSSAVAAIFAARCWITTANGVDEATCSGAWIEVTP